MAGPRASSIVRQLRRAVLRESRDGSSDGLLLQSFIAERDEAAFEGLVERHGPMVWGVCQRVLRNQHDTEDVFQATFLVLARKAASVSPREKLANWLYGVAFQTAVRARSARARRQIRERQVANMPEPVARDRDLWDDLQPLLDQEIARLPARYREVVVLCDLQGRTRREVAGQLRIAEGTVASRLATGRKTLAKRLARYVPIVSGGTLASILSQNVSSAGVPNSAVSAAVHAANQVGMGQAVGGVSANAAALAEGTITAMFLKKLKAVTVVLLLMPVLALGMFAFGVPLLAHQPPDTGPKGSQPAQNVQSRFEEPDAPVVETPRKDRFGDPLPEGAIARLGTLRYRHPFWVSALAYTAGEKTLVSACWDGGVRVWDPETGKELRCFPADPGRTAQGLGACLGVAVTPDNKTVITVENGETLRALDLASGKERWQVKSGNGFSMALAPDGKSIAKGLSGENKQQVSLWDVDTGKHLRTLGVTNRSVPALAFSRDGKLVAAGESAAINANEKTDLVSSIWLWDPADGSRVRELKGHTRGVAAVAFSPVGSLLASASHDASIRLWNAADGRLLRKIAVPQDPYPQDELGADSDGQHGGVVAIAFSADGRWLASGGYDGSVRLWDVDTGKAIHVMRGHGREVTSVVFSRDGNVLTSGSRDQTICLWNTATGKELQPREGHSGLVHAIAISPNGGVAATACEDRSIHLWSLATGQELRILRGHTGGVYCVAFSPDGHALASASADQTIRIWDAETGQEMRQLLGHAGAVYAVAFTKVDKLLLSGGADRTLRFWDWSNGKQVRALTADSRVFNMNLSRDGRIVGTNGERAQFWDVVTGKEVHRAGSASMTLASDGKSFVTHDVNGTVQVWNLPSGKEQYAFPGPGPKWEPGYVGTPDMLLSPDGRLLAMREGNGFAVWEMSTGKVRRHFSGHQGYFNTYAFSPDGRTLLTGGQDTTILVWDLARQHERQPDRIAPEKLETMWRDLGGADAERADQAIGTLVALARQSVPFLDRKLVPTPIADPKRLEALIRDIDSDDFAVRQRASTDLENLGERAAPALKRALEQSQSIETRLRIEKLLAIVRPPLGASEQLQALRAVEVLERIDNPEARTLLKRLAGAADSLCTQEAINALRRLDRRHD
jgi:RNA polymerase sigma factor (sigma-70 family)